MSRLGWVVVLLVMWPGLVGGQVLPGAKSKDRDAIHAQFLDAVLRGIRVTSNDWVDAWSRDDAEGVGDAYLEDALLVSLEGERFVGREEILSYLQQALPSQGTLQTFLMDVDASNNMAATVERFEMTPSRGDEVAYQGLLFTVYLSDGRRWRIRSQMFRPLAEPS